MSKTVVSAAFAAALLSFVVPRTSAAEGSEAAAFPVKTTELDWKETLRRARERGPLTSLARSRIAEAEARRVDAEIFPRQNPVLEVGAGPRLIGTDPDSPYVQIALSQPIDLGGGRAARLRLAEAGVAQARAETDADAQLASREAGGAFLRALWAGERAKLAEQSLESARAALASAKKRLEAGDATALEVNVARSGLARAGAALRGYEAEREAALGLVRVLAGVDPKQTIELRGDLADPLLADRSRLSKAALARPEIRALAAEVEAARAQEDLSDALAWPQLGLGAAYQLEDKNVHTVFGTLSLTLPIFERAQGLGAEARARLARAERAEAATAERVQGEVATALGVLRKRDAAIHAFDEQGGVEAFRENMALAGRGYAAGETSLSDLLLMQRELVETEADRLDRLLELRATELEALAAAGALR